MSVELIIGIVGVIFTTLLGVIAWFLRRWFNKQDEETKGIQKEIKTLTTLATQTDKSVAILATALQNTMPDLVIPQYKTGSPLKLTDEGKENAINSGMMDYAKTHIVQYGDRLKNLDYEVQVFNECHKIAQEIITPPTIDIDILKIQDYYYNKGIVNKEVIEYTFALVLRDVFLQEKAQQQVSKNNKQGV